MGGKGSGNPNLSGKPGKMAVDAVQRRTAKVRYSKLLTAELERASLEANLYEPEKSNIKAIADKIVKGAYGMGKDAWPSIDLVKILAERLEGKPVQPVDVNVTEEFANRTREEKIFKLTHGYWPEEAETKKRSDTIQ
jgi:hypothetical protein